MKIIQKLIPDHVKPKFIVNGKSVVFSMKPEYITIHETANTAKGANDLAHANLQYNGNSRNASWHLQVDEDSCYQSLKFDEAGLHAGDGANGKGNRKSIAIEICVNSDGNFDKAVQNAAEVTAQLMKQFNIPSYKVVPHKHWSGKNCPANLLKKWQWFINLVIAERGKLDVTIKEEDDMLEKAIVINAFPDFPNAEILAARLKAPIYTRAALPAGKVAKELYVVGGSTQGMQADKIISLTGKDRYEVAAAVSNFLKK